MRVPLSVGKMIGGPKLVLYATIRQAKYNIYGPIRFMVDTGSHWTVISEVDWRRWRFSFGKLGKPRSFTGIGGGTILGYPMENVIIRAKNIEGDIVSFNMPFIYFLKSSKAKSKTSTFPSILGVDFLIQNKFILYFDPNNKVAYLETT